VSYPTHPVSFRLRSSPKLWGYSAITAFDKYCQKSTKYRLLFTKLLPQLLSIFGLISIKFKIFFTDYLELYVIAFKVKSGGLVRVKKNLITRIKDYRPFSYKWPEFYGKGTPFFHNFDFATLDDPRSFFNQELSISKS
jgi:hypothetical protein